MEYREEYIAIKRELVKETLAEIVIKNVDFLGIDFNSIADTQALKILDEIRKVLLGTKTDHQTVTEIKQIFDNHKVSYTKSIFER